MAKVVGVGGVFLKARDPQALRAWYGIYLGIPAGADEGSLAFDGPDSMGITVFAHFPADTAYFGDGPQPFMLNFRVDDLDALLAQLAASGVRIDAKREDYSYGGFCVDLGPRGQPGGAATALVSTSMSLCRIRRLCLTLFDSRVRSVRRRKTRVLRRTTSD